MSPAAVPGVLGHAPGILCTIPYNTLVVASAMAAVGFAGFADVKQRPLAR